MSAPASTSWGETSTVQTCLSVMSTVQCLMVGDIGAMMAVCSLPPKGKGTGRRCLSGLPQSHSLCAFRFNNDPKLRPLLRDSAAGDVAMDQGSSQAMLVAAARSFAAGIETGDDRALGVDDLTLAVDPHSPIGVVPDSADRSGIERRLLDLVHGGVLSAPEIGIVALIDIGVPLANRLLEMLERHALELVARVDLLGQIVDGVGAEEVAVVGGEGRADVPLGALDRAAVEDRPQRSGVEVRRLGAFVHRHRGVNRRIFVIHLLDPARMAVAPVALHLFE